MTNAITATGEHRSSNEGLTLMSSLEDLHICNQKTQSAVNSLMPQLRKLEQGLDRLERRLLPGIPGLETPQEPLQTLVEHQKRHSSVFSFTAATAITVATLYLMFRAATGWTTVIAVNMCAGHFGYFCCNDLLNSWTSTKFLTPNVLFTFFPRNWFIFILLVFEMDKVRIWINVDWKLTRN